jgi:hypothetical protein
VTGAAEAEALAIAHLMEVVLEVAVLTDLVVALQVASEVVDHALAVLETRSLDKLRCLVLYVLHVKSHAKYHSSQTARSQYIATIVSVKTNLVEQAILQKEIFHQVQIRVIQKKISVLCHYQLQNQQLMQGTSVK